MRDTTGYEPEIVFAFIEAYALMRGDGEIEYLNDVRLTDSRRETLRRWRTKEFIPLSGIDEFLMKHDLMLSELEQWAIANFGRDGFVDSLADPKELVV
jgi:hypothetical protein